MKHQKSACKFSNPLLVLMTAASEAASVIQKPPNQSLLSDVKSNQRVVGQILSHKYK